MPHFVLSKIVEALNVQRKAVNGSRLLILGVAYKKDIGDVRESPALDVIKLLQDRGAEVVYNDPYVEEITLDHGVLRSSALSDDLLATSDCTIIITDHSSYDYARVVEKARSVVDTRNATRDVKADRKKITKI